MRNFSRNIIDGIRIIWNMYECSNSKGSLSRIVVLNITRKRMYKDEIRR